MMLNKASLIVKPVSESGIRLFKDAVLIFFEVDDQKSETDKSRIEPNHQSASFDNSLSHYPLSLLVLY